MKGRQTTETRWSLGGQLLPQDPGHVPTSFQAGARPATRLVTLGGPSLWHRHGVCRAGKASGCAAQAACASCPLSSVSPAWALLATRDRVLPSSRGRRPAAPCLGHFGALVLPPPMSRASLLIWPQICQERWPVSPAPLWIKNQVSWACPHRGL